MKDYKTNLNKYKPLAIAFGLFAATVGTIYLANSISDRRAEAKERKMEQTLIEGYLNDNNVLDKYYIVDDVIYAVEVDGQKVADADSLEKRLFGN